MSKERRNAECATQLLGVLMTPNQKATYADLANILGLLLGCTFSETAASFMNRTCQRYEYESMKVALKHWSGTRVAPIDH